MKSEDLSHSMGETNALVVVGDLARTDYSSCFLCAFQMLLTYLVVFGSS